MVRPICAGGTQTRHRNRLHNAAWGGAACAPTFESRKCNTQACPVDCISLQKGEQENGRWYPEFFRINFSRCIFCGMCEEACPTSAIQLTPDFEMGEYDRQQLVYEKEDLLINGPGKDHDYHFYKVAGMAIGGKDKGQAQNEEAPEDVRTLLP